MPTSISDKTRLRAFLDREAHSAGFEAVGVVAPDAIPLAPARLKSFLDAGFHATMDWLADRADKRADPRRLWPEVRSIVMLGMNYGPQDDPLSTPARRDRATISVYARNRDYHEVMKGRLKTIAGKLKARSKAEVKVFVDTAPVMEKPLAQAAGLGWQGKHTNLVSRDFGSWLFLGAIFSAAEIAFDRQEADHCGQCRACLDACPTLAFPAPYRLDAGRCISYLTIEHDGPIPREFRAAIGNRVHGCDDCLAACPWNKFARSASEMKLQARGDLRAPAIADLLMLDDTVFRTLFSGSTVKRIGRDRFVRNVLIAAGNSDEPSLTSRCEALLGDASPTVRGGAVWALSRLASPADFAALAKRHAATEMCPDVLAEWREGMVGS